MPTPPVSRTHLLWLTRGWCWFDGLQPATDWITTPDLGPIPCCCFCKRLKGKKDLEQYRRYHRPLGDFWGEAVGLPLPLEQHYNPTEWGQHQPVQSSPLQSHKPKSPPPDSPQSAESLLAHLLSFED